MKLRNRIITRNITINKKSKLKLYKYLIRTNTMKGKRNKNGDVYSAKLKRGTNSPHGRIIWQKEKKNSKVKIFNFGPFTFSQTQRKRKRCLN